MKTETTNELIRLLASERRIQATAAGATPERRILIGVLEAAIVLSGECDKKDAMPEDER